MFMLSAIGQRGRCALGGRGDMGELEDAAFQAIEALAAMDPTKVDLDVVLAIHLKLHALQTQACQAQMRVAADD